MPSHLECESSDLHLNVRGEEKMSFVYLTMSLVLASPAGLVAKDQRQNQN
jgi:hypothetical protein